MPAESCVFAGDDSPDTVHFAAYQNGAIIGVASLYHEGSLEAVGVEAWRLRGMATSDAARGTGVGGLLLEKCVQHARANLGRLLWCNARKNAVGFYLRYGFERLGDEFEIPGIGTHIYMHLWLDK